MPLPKNVNIDTLPVYQTELLQQNSIVICQFLENYEEYLVNEKYALPFEAAKDLSSKGICVFSEKAIIKRKEIKNGH